MHLDEIIKRKPYEKILHVIRPHWITFVPTALLHVFLALIPAPLVFYVLPKIPQITENPTYYAVAILFASAFELSIALFYYASFVIYYLDMIVITNDRLVEVSQRNLFSRSVSELDLYKIQDATSDVQGFIATVINYGQLDIQTAGESSNFSFKNIPGPHELRRELMELSEADRKFHGSQHV